MNNSDWSRNFALMLEAYELTFEDVRAALPRVVSSLSSDEVQTLDGADLDHPEHLNEDQARIFCLLLVRAAARLATEWAERERLQRSARN